MSTDAILDNLATVDNRGLSWLVALLLEIAPSTAGSIVVPTEDVLNAVSIGLPMIYNLNASERLSGQSSPYNAAKALTFAFNQAPTIAQAIWNGPPANDSTNLQRLGKDAELADGLKKQVRQKIQRGLDLIINDVPSFIAFTDNGLFSGPDYLIFDSAYSVLDQGLRTYAASTILARQNFTGVFFAESNTTAAPALQCTGDFVCFPPRDAGVSDGVYSGTRSAIYNSPNSLASYRLQARVPQQRVTEAPPDWGNLDPLMNGGFLCHALGNDRRKVVSVSPARGLDFTCASRLDFCRDPQVKQCPEVLGASRGACPVPTCGLGE